MHSKENTVPLLPKHNNEKAHTQRESFRHDMNDCVPAAAYAAWLTSKVASSRVRQMQRQRQKSSFSHDIALLVNNNPHIENRRII